MLADKLRAAALSTIPTYIEDVFSTYLYTGNGSTQTITNGIDLSTKGGLVWIKGRTNTFNHFLRSDGIGNKYLSSNNTASATDASGFGYANSTTGFSITTSQNILNGTGNTYASWTFRKQPKFFDVVTYTGNGSNRTISHNLGSVPGCIIVKRTDAAADWQVYHRSLANTEYLVLNTTAAKATGTTRWNSTTPTSTVFSLGTDTTVNANGGTYVAYLFAHDAGGFGLTGTDNVISCGSFTTGTGGKISAPVNLGYEVQWLLVKNIGASENWQIYDVMRGMPVSNGIPVLYPNLSDAEYFAPTSSLAPTATGFNTPTAAGPFANSSTYIYIAIRRGPMKVPTSGTSVFYPIARTGTSTATSISGIGFVPDFFLSQNRNTPGDPGPASSLSLVLSRLTNLQFLRTQLTSAEGTSTEVTSWNQSGVSLSADVYGRVNWSSITAINYLLGRAPGFFDVVCYTGTGSATTQTHNLGVAPELLIVKMRSGTNPWPVYASAQGATKYTTLNSNSAFSTAGSSTWNNTSPTASVFSVGNSAEVNGSGSTYVAYLFATVSGVSKVGSYTGTGALQTINCGFTGGARFVLIKRTDSTGDWFYWDSARGIVAGDDPYLRFNSTGVEVTNTDYVDTYSAGFEISSTAPAAINANGGTFIYLAIA